jgi:hypothetical protein
MPFGYREFGKQSYRQKPEFVRRIRCDKKYFRCFGSQENVISNPYFTSSDV